MNHAYLLGPAGSFMNRMYIFFKDISPNSATFKGGLPGRVPGTFAKERRPPMRKSHRAMRGTSGKGYSWTNS